MNQADYSRKHYEKNKEKRLADNKARREAAKDYLRKIKESNPCADCDNFWPYYVMHFDHVRGEKIVEVSALASKGWSIKRIETEVEKCDVVCANCHAERTWKRGQEFGF